MNHLCRHIDHPDHNFCAANQYLNRAVNIFSQSETYEVERGFLFRSPATLEHSWLEVQISKFRHSVEKTT
jgi:hypothetical protein